MVPTYPRHSTIFQLIRSHSRAADILAGLGVRGYQLGWTLEATVREIGADLPTVEAAIVRATAATRPAGAGVAA